MSNTPEDFATIFEKAKHGCSEALGELFIRYSARVQAVVHRRLVTQLRSQFDSTDCTQDVWISFLKMSLTQLTFPDEKAFLSYLMQMAINKLMEEDRRRKRSKCDLNREEHLSEEDALAPGGTVSQLALAEDEMEKFAEGLPPLQRQVLEMLRAGCDHEEIAEVLGINAKTVQRLLKRIKARTGMDS